MSTYSKNLFDVLGDGEVPRPAPVKEEAPVVIDKKSVSKINKDAARAAKGGKPTKGARQQNGRPQRGRQFDRHSGTGIVDTEKKVNKGWGKAGSSEAEAAKDTLNPADPDAPEAEAAAPVEEEEQVKTLDEYLAEKANKSLKVSLPEARKANDADDSAFKGTVAFAKEDFEEFYVAKETKTKKTTEKVRKEKVFVEIEQRFQEKARPEFRKNDRRGGRGGNNNNKNNRRSTKNAAAPAVNLQDASAFPTLGATA
ncbi:unnamed protein product [Mucor circinelloides]|uniref:Hyaluronan/mRNA-binding protein domain-containing protein n=1 Tax=Mucor circinelloides f. circinelloides (strain 1006PhL) TaxID=1220926 RepID=S2JMF6_MUCC1|nr:hypothetical protein HMPREF1544_02044 [Mucor circinelloides 1006PhL]